MYTSNLTNGAAHTAAPVLRQCERKKPHANKQASVYATSCGM